MSLIDQGCLLLPDRLYNTAREIVCIISVVGVVGIMALSASYMHINDDDFDENVDDCPRRPASKLAI